MGVPERDDDFAVRRERLRGLSDEALRDRFWELVERIVSPLVDEARTHTTPAIERSVLLRMGFSSVEAKSLVEAFSERRLLGRGAGCLVLALSQARDISVREAGTGLLRGDGWEALPS